MSAKAVLDTGALISLLDRSQSRHVECLEFFESFTGEFATTEAVLTEATHLLGRVSGGRLACVDFVLAGGATLVPSTNASLRRARGLVQKYADLPMDFADATLVVLAEDLDSAAVFTTDRKDFSVYRFRGRRKFRIFP